MKNYRLILRVCAESHPIEFEFGMAEAPEAFSFVDKFSEFKSAEIWSGAQLVCHARAHADLGNLWTVNPFLEAPPVKRRLLR